MSSPITYRPFRNTDPPILAAMWRSVAHTRGRLRAMSTAILERMVLAKPYFDRQGLIVAEQDGKPVGLAHAGFGPTDDRSTLDTELGVTCLVLVPPHAEEDAIFAELLARSEQYLRDAGAKVLYAGAIFPLNPFYLGIYGGSEMPGVLESDADSLRRFSAAGYREIDRVVVLQRRLDSFRPIVDRKQMQVRQKHEMRATIDPPAANWWEACTLGELDVVQYELASKETGAPLVKALFWDMLPLAGCWGTNTVGLMRIDVSEEARRQGLATYLIGETLRQVQKQGSSLAEVHVMQSNAGAIALYKKLGFEIIDHGIVLRKET